MNTIKSIFKNKIFRVCLIVIIITYPFFKDFGFIYSTGESMLPTYEDKELILIHRAKSLGENWTPQRGQVIIAVDEKDGDSVIKRVIGLEGDYIKIQNGYIFINGKQYVDSRSPNKNITYWLEPEEERMKKPKNEWLFLNTDEDVGKVPEGYVWVIGDNRSMSWYGLVKIQEIKGLVLF